MLDFDKKQMEMLKGNYSLLAESCGVSREYVKLVLTGKRNTVSPKAQEIVEKAKSIVDILKN